MTRPATMKDVAAEAGVALKTVSRFVNGETNINPALAARIAEAIERLSYRRNLAAASIRPGWTSKTIGLLISDLANPYYSSIARAVESVAREHGYLLITASSEENGKVHDSLVDSLFERQIDALITVPPRESGRPWSAVRVPHPPVVFLDRPGSLPGADTVLSDNRGGSREAVKTLLHYGERVAFVGDSLTIHTMSERHRGYLDAFGSAGLVSLVELTLTSAHAEEDAYEAVRELLAMDAADSIFAANNRAAIGALRAFAEVGRRVPIIGFDDFEAATAVVPRLSVVSQNTRGMGTIAARIAIDRATGVQSPRRTTTLPTELVLRGSEAPPQEFDQLRTKNNSPR